MSSDLPEKYLQIAADAMPEGATFQETCGVARAILASVEEEREACARLTENAKRTTFMHWDPEGLEPVETKIDYREKIASAIRARKGSPK